VYVNICENNKEQGNNDNGLHRRTDMRTADNEKKRAVDRIYEKRMKKIESFFILDS